MVRAHRRGLLCRSRHWSQDALWAAQMHRAYPLLCHTRDGAAGTPGLILSHCYLWSRLRTVLLVGLTTGRMELLEDLDGPRSHRHREARLFRVYCGPDGAADRRAQIDPAASRLHDRVTFGSYPTRQSDALDFERTCQAAEPKQRQGPGFKHATSRS